jgi:hypothetical protein
MKKTFTVIVLPIYLLSTSLSRDEIIQMVSKIKEERGGIELKVLNSTPNPFAMEKRIIQEPKKVEVKDKKHKIVKVEENYELTAILNHRAFINKKWYSVGDKIGSFKVYSIGNISVILKGQEGIKKLNIADKKRKIKLFKGN